MRHILVIFYLFVDWILSLDLNFIHLLKGLIARTRAIGAHILVIDSLYNARSRLLPVDTFLSETSKLVRDVTLFINSRLLIIIGFEIGARRSF